MTWMSARIMQVLLKLLGLTFEWDVIAVAATRLGQMLVLLDFWPKAHTFDCVQAANPMRLHSNSLAHIC